MKPRIFHRLVSISDALKTILDVVKPSPKGVEYVDIDNALYRVLANDIYSPVDHPPFDRSEVDGYAVRAFEIANATELNPVVLPLQGFLKPGDPGYGLRCCENSIKVSTGAVIPPECDAVVMVEYSDEQGDKVKIYRPVSPGENISTTGSDISAGDLVLPRGVLIRYEHVALLAGLGISRVPVYIRPRAVVYSTGSEVVAPGSRLEYGKVYDTNGYLITSFLRELGFEAVYKGILPDNYEAVYNALISAIEEFDVIFTSGGTSAGETDIVYRVFEDLGSILVHGLKTKPGKPTVVATARGKLLFGLPGFPLSCYMILISLVKPIVTRLSGIRSMDEKIRVKIPFKIKKGVGKTWLIPSILVETSKGLSAYPVTLSSGSIYAITFSDGFIELDEELDVVEADSEVPFYMFTERSLGRRLVIIGSNDTLLEHILVKTGLIYKSKILNTGSLGGWHAISRGEADIAPTHLLDPDSNKYNTPFLAKYGLVDKALLIRGYDRLIGFIVPRGNPKRIEGFGDFFRDDIKIVNRPRGSGIRTILDINLRKIAQERGIQWSTIHRVIKGYTYEVKTHTAVALAVKYGKADVGIAVGYVAELFDLDFIPIQWEEYDFLILREKLTKPEVQSFISILRGLKLEDFRFEKYYRIPREAGSIKSS